MIRNILTTCKKSITYHIIIIHCVAADASASSQHHPTSIPGTVMPMVKGTPTRSMLPSETDTLQCQAATRATQTQKLRIYIYMCVIIYKLHDPFKMQGQKNSLEILLLNQSSNVCKLGKIISQGEVRQKSSNIHQPAFPVPPTNLGHINGA